ncbi:MAG: hypothetical protein AABW54_02685 [Candidatus Micrarchaeota archaeon]
MKRSHGSYSKHSRNMAARPRETVRQRLADYKAGERVRIRANPMTKNARPFLRFSGRTCTVVERRGASYVVMLKDGDKAKQLVVSNRHLERY